MKYLSISDVITLHDQYVQMFGGSLGIRDEKLLESAVFRPVTSYGGEELYLTVFEKVAALFHSLLFNHAFVDGNKRAALFCADRMLFLNGYEFTATNKEAGAFPLFVEAERPEIDEIAKWFKGHCRRIKRVNKK